MLTVSAISAPPPLEPPHAQHPARHRTLAASRWSEARPKARLTNGLGAIHPYMDGDLTRLPWRVEFSPQPRALRLLSVCQPATRPATSPGHNNDEGYPRGKNHLHVLHVSGHGSLRALPVHV